MTTLNIKYARLVQPEDSGLGLYHVCVETNDIKDNSKTGYYLLKHSFDLDDVDQAIGTVAKIKTKGVIDTDRWHSLQDEEDLITYDFY